VLQFVTFTLTAMEDRNINPSLNSGKTLGGEDVELTRGYTGSTTREGPGRTPSSGIISRDGETYFGVYITLGVLCLVSAVLKQ
jgi:hypothetical protein